MARTVAIEEPKTTKRKPGRPKKQRVIPDEIEEATDPEPAESTPPVEDDDDWMWLSQFTDADWGHMICYLHRTHPITDRKSGGKPVAVEKIGRRFDADTIMKTHGSGGYRADVVKINPTNGKHTRIRQFYFVIRNMDYPPKIPLGDWTEDPRNEEWKWAEPLLQKQQGGTMGQPDVAKLFQTVLQGVEQVQGKREDNTQLALGVLQMVKDSNERLAKLTDPVTQLSTIKELIAAVAPPKQSGIDPTMQMMFTMMTEQLKSTREELTAMRAIAMKPQPSLIEQFVSAMPLIKELTSSLGLARKSETPNEWASVAEKVVEESGKVIPELVQAWKMKIAAENAKVGPPVSQQNRPSANGSAAATTAGGDPKKEAIVNKYGQLLISVAPFLIDHFKMDLGGAEFRNWFIGRQGAMAWTGLRDDAGAELVIELIQMHPTLKEVLQPLDKLRQFMIDFFSEPELYPEPETPGQEETLTGEIINAPAN